MKEVFNGIEFNIERPDAMVLSNTFTVTFCNKGAYGLKIPPIIKTKLFGEIDLRLLTNREIVLMCIAFTVPEDK